MSDFPQFRKGMRFSDLNARRMQHMSDAAASVQSMAVAGLLRTQSEQTLTLTIPPDRKLRKLREAASILERLIVWTVLPDVIECRSIGGVAEDPPIYVAKPPLLRTIDFDGLERDGARYDYSGKDPQDTELTLYEQDNMTRYAEQDSDYQRVGGQPLLDRWIEVIRQKYVRGDTLWTATAVLDVTVLVDNQHITVKKLDTNPDARQWHLRAEIHNPFNP